MKAFSKIVLLAGLGVVLSLQSCKYNEHVLTKYHKPIYFAPLERDDIKIVSGLTAEASVVVVSGGKVLESEYSKDYKNGNLKGLTSVQNISQYVIAKKYITTFRYDGTMDLVARPSATEIASAGFWTKFKNIFAGVKTTSLVKDYAMDFALYALMEKYPDIDYFTNVQIERIKVITGKKATETLKIKAHGIELKTDG